MARTPRYLLNSLSRSFADRAIAEGKRKKALLFVNKKKQKNFVSLGRAGFTGTGQSHESFCAAFFKKRLLS
jgi:hypothetical protein